MAIRSHKMPKAYLKRFATAPERGKRYGKLWVYERGKTPRIGTAHSEAAERGFFVSRAKNGSLDDFSTEAWAGKIEDDALDTLISAPSPMFVWARENRNRMARYWALMFLRSTSFYDFHKRSSDELFDVQMRRLNSDPDFRKKIVSNYAVRFGRPFTEDEILGVIGAAVNGLLTSEQLRSQYVGRLKLRVDLIAGVLLNKLWQIWTSPDNCEFVTCDSPVMTFRLDNWGRYSVGDGFGKEGSIVILPISPTACLIGGVQGAQSRHVPGSDVHEINKIIISSSVRFVYSLTRSIEIEQLVQGFAGSIRPGINAFTRSAADDSLDLFF